MLAPASNSFTTYCLSGRGNIVSALVSYDPPRPGSKTSKSANAPRKFVADSKLMGPVELNMAAIANLSRVAAAFAPSAGDAGISRMHEGHEQ